MMPSSVLSGATLLKLIGKVRRLVRFGLTCGSTNPARARHVLFLQYETALGSAVNATPIYEALKELRPDLRISVASTGLAYGTVRHNPWIDRLIETADPHTNFTKVAWQLSRATFTNGHIDCIVTNFGNMKKRMALLGLLNPTASQFGYTLAPELYDATLQPDPGISVLANNLRLADIFAEQTKSYEPRVFFPEQAILQVARILAKKRQIDPRMLVVFVTQTSGGQPTRWYDDRFASVADYLIARHAALIAFVGTAKESAGIDKIRAAMTHDSANLAGETDLATLSALLCSADLVITLDTGTMHVARAAGVPMVIIASAWQPAHEWLPLDQEQCHILRRNVASCPGCRNFVCATRACMEEITVEDAIRASELLLATYPPSADARQRRLERSCSRTDSAHPASTR